MAYFPRPQTPSDPLGTIEQTPSDPSSERQRDERVDSDWRIYVRLLAYVKPWSAYFYLSILGFLLYSAGNVLLADLLGYLLDAINDDPQQRGGIVAGAVHFFTGAGNASDREIARIAVPLAMVLIASGRSMGFFAGAWCLHCVARHVIHQLRCELFHALQLAPAHCYRQQPAGVLVSRITYNVEQVTDAVTRALKTVIREGFVVLALLSYLFYVNWTLALVFLGVAPIIAGLVYAIGRHFRRYSRRIQDSMAEITQVSAEAISGYREVRMFGGQRQQGERFRQASDHNRVQSTKLAFVDALSSPLIQCLLACALALMVWLALSPAMLGEFSAGQFAAFVTAAAQLGKPLRQLSGVQGIIQRGLAAAQDIFSALALPTEPDRGSRMINRCRGEISFRNVCFTYPGDHAPALQDVTIDVKAGETVALVGRSGSGKSTLLHLLTRFYQADAGSVLLDGYAVEEYSLVDLRRQFAVVSQQPVLVRDTVFANIAFGGLCDVSVEQVKKAAQAAEALSFIDRLPAGFDTWLGDNGGGLSGGEQQRLAIARAVLKSAPVLLLDEATSALDNESDQRVQSALARLMAEQTTLVVAHRLSTVERADRIIVLDGGRVIAQGSHRSLLEAGGLYSQLYQREFAA